MFVGHPQTHFSYCNVSLAEGARIWPHMLPRTCRSLLLLDAETESGDLRLQGQAIRWRPGRPCGGAAGSATSQRLLNSAPLFPQSDWERALKQSTTVYVGNLSFCTREEQIYEVFSKVSAWLHAWVAGWLHAWVGSVHGASRRDAWSRSPIPSRIGLMVACRTLPTHSYPYKHTFVGFHLLILSSLEPLSTRWGT